MLNILYTGWLGLNTGGREIVAAAVETDAIPCTQRATNLHF